MLKAVAHVKGKAELFKCIKWDPVCISKFKKLVMHAKEKDKLSLKAQNARDVLARKF